MSVTFLLCLKWFNYFSHINKFFQFDIIYDETKKNLLLMIFMWTEFFLQVLLIYIFVFTQIKYNKLVLNNKIIIHSFGNIKIGNYFPSLIITRHQQNTKILNCNHTMQWSTDLDFAFILSSVFLNSHGILILPGGLFQPCLQSLLVPVHLGFHLLQLLCLLEYVVLKNKKIHIQSIYSTAKICFGINKV